MVSMFKVKLDGAREFLVQEPVVHNEARFLLPRFDGPCIPLAVADESSLDVWHSNHPLWVSVGAVMEGDD